MTYKTLDELLADEETALLVKTKAEIAREDAEWAALPPDRKLAIIAEREARYADTPDDDEEDEDDETA
jgi:hypothetical protein